MAAVYCENIRVFQESLKKNTKFFSHTSFCLLPVIVSLNHSFVWGQVGKLSWFFKLSRLLVCFFFFWSEFIET